MKRKNITQYCKNGIRILLRVYSNGKISNHSQIIFIEDVNKAAKEYYRKRSLEVKKKIYKKRIQKKLKIIDYLGGKCQRCGLISPYPEIYDVHHVNPKDKSWGVHTPVMLKFEDIKNELDKCILLCSNCHRIIHAGIKDKEYD